MPFRGGCGREVEEGSTDLRLDVGVDESEGEVAVELGPGAAQVVHGQAVRGRRARAGARLAPVRHAPHRQAVALLHHARAQLAVLEAPLANLTSLRSITVSVQRVAYTTGIRCTVLTQFSYQLAGKLKKIYCIVATE